MRCVMWPTYVCSSLDMPETLGVDALTTEPAAVHAVLARVAKDAGDCRRELAIPEAGQP